MPSLRLLTFLVVSMVGHAAILVPLSDDIPALFDSEDTQSDTVIVSISVISSTEVPIEEKSETDEPAHPFHQTAQPSDADQQRTEQHNTLIEALPEDQAPTKPSQTVPAAAESVSVEAPATESKPERASAVERQQTDQVSRVAQNEELKARQHRQLRAEERYLGELLNAIARHRFYPRNARRKGHQGSVEIELTILKNGEFESVRISKASNYHSLNKATTRALNRLKRFKPFPADIQRDSWHISIPFRYVLNKKLDNRS